MHGFLQNAVAVFESAEAAPRDEQATDLAILIDAGGALRVVDGAGWHPETLEAHYGAQAVYQVTRGPRGVQVNARSGRKTCVLTSGQQASAGNPVWGPLSRYSFMPHMLLPAAATCLPALPDSPQTT